MKAILLLPLVLCIGCAVNKSLVPMGGSKADGIVELGYDYTTTENPKVNAAQGQVTAAARCRAWGYQNAQPFGGQKRQCNYPGNYGCGGWHVTLTYQCV